ncbi:MAG TPA: ABC transporter permease, partial [Longimicrobiales bacterium]|nr:ABC transporter permease [Longimicrobiales bacterium]
MASWIEGWARELGQAVRGLARSPAFSLVAVFTLAVGLGGSAAIYTLLDRVVLDPLPYPEPERLVDLDNAVPGIGEGTVWGLSTAQQVHLEDRATTLDATGLYRAIGANILTPEGPQRVRGWLATREVLPLLGARPLLGRIFDAEDLRPGGPDIVILSHGFWQRRFGSDPDVVGRTLTIDDAPYEVVGVLEPGFRVPGAPPLLAAADIWLTLPIDRAGPFWNSHVYLGIGRLAPGQDPAAAEAEIAGLWTELPERFPNAYGGGFMGGSGMRARVVPMAEAVVGPMARNLWILFEAVGLVLLIAWANVSNLFLVRVETRRQELDIRSALGAGRAAIARYLLAEGLTLSLAGGVLAVLICFWGVPALVALAPEALPRAFEVAVGPDTVLYTLALALGAGLALALYPLIRYAGRAGVGALATGARSGGAGRARQRLRSALVAGQVALALTLTVAAGLFVESLRRLGDLDPGVEPEGLVAAGIYLSPARYTDDQAVWSTLRSMLERVRAIPGVTAAGMSEELPVEGGFGCTVQGFEDPAVRERLNQAGLSTCAGQESTTPGWFETAGIPLLRGRTLTEANHTDPSVGAVVVSRAFAERFWPGEDPIGKGVAPSGRTVPPFYHVVGVVDDVPAGSLEGDPAMAIYYPIRGLPDVPGDWGRFSPLSLELLVRTDRGDPLSVMPRVRAAIHEVDPDVPVADVRTMERVVADSTARYTFTS